MLDIGEWFRSNQAIRRYWFAATISVPLILKVSIISQSLLLPLAQAFLYSFQIWRPFTVTFYFPVGPGTGFLIWSIYISYISIPHGSKQELLTGGQQTLHASLYLDLHCYCIGLAMDMKLLMIPRIMSVLYVWAQLNRDLIVSFWFGTRFKACYLPWVILGFICIIRGS